MPTLTSVYSFNKPLVNNATDADLWGGYLNANWDSVDSILDGFSVFPAGAMVDYGGSTAPSGWLLCYGQEVSRTTYSDLFTAIGTTYGAGDGSTTFDLPDLRGRVVAGLDNMGSTSANRLTNQSGGVDGDTLGATGGNENHTLTSSQMPSHTHSYSQSVNGYSAVGIGGNGTLVATAGGATLTPPYSITTSSAGSGGAHNNVQPTIILTKIIKT